MMPTTYLLPSLDAQECTRLESGRPASRAEIIARHLRERRDNEPLFAPEETIVAHPRPALTRPVATLRHSLGRALVSAGQRLDREAA
ncbi:MAG TPA: hypothetical protein VM450_14325 [Thermomicrobiales bacterium]|nr:hypothetical protein [Thermomicrobiales bacterium]